MIVSRIQHDQVFVCQRKDLPPRWAAELARALASALSQATVDLAQERVVALGDGISLAHVRTSLVQQVTIAAYKALDAEGASEWLWLMVLIPEGDVARHLGWLAHLAAVLHDDDNRRRLKSVSTAALVGETLEAILAVSSQRLLAKSAIGARQRAPTATTHRLIVAIVKGDETVDHLLTLYLEHEVHGATIMDGIGMGEHLAAHVSLFAGFRMAFKAIGRSHVVLVVVPAERSEEVLELTRLAMKGSQTGIAWAMDVAGAIVTGGGG